MYALSLDDVSDLAKFVKTQELNFRLLSDPDGSVASKYGVLVEKRRFARRVTFVLDEEGVVQLVDEKVDVNTHGDELVESIARLRER